jgi:hypothetical protein
MALRAGAMALGLAALVNVAHTTFGHSAPVLGDRIRPRRLRSKPACFVAPALIGCPDGNGLG